MISYGGKTAPWIHQLSALSVNEPILEQSTELLWSNSINPLGLCQVTRHREVAVDDTPPQFLDPLYLSQSRQIMSAFWSRTSTIPQAYPTTQLIYCYEAAS